MKRQFAKWAELLEVFEVYVTCEVSKSKLQILQCFWTSDKPPTPNFITSTQTMPCHNMWSQGTVSVERLWRPSNNMTK